jgi:hypothetical protein
MPNASSELSGMCWTRATYEEGHGSSAVSVMSTGYQIPLNGYNLLVCYSAPRGRGSRSNRSRSGALYILIARSFLRLTTGRVAEAPLHFQRRKAVEPTFRGLPPPFDDAIHSVSTFGNGYKKMVPFLPRR